jgi:TRAP-type uncharacterized transport system substrate-binding protein
MRALRAIRLKGIAMPHPDSWAEPVVTRSRLVLEMAAALVAAPDQPLRQAKVLLRPRVGGDVWPVTLFGSATREGIRAVASGDASLAIVNPSAALTLAYRGHPSFDGPQPVRMLAVLPSFDQCVVVVHPHTNLTSVEDIARRRYPLRMRTRGTRDHSLGYMIHDVLAAAGFTLDDLRSWGGDVLFDGDFPRADGPDFAAFLRGDVDAMFEEGLGDWLAPALDAGMVVLPLGAAAIERLQTMGYRPGLVERALYPQLPSDVPTIDFSGWAIFVHADLPDDLVRQLCAALDERKHLIPWQGDGPLPLERMCSDSPATPIDVPLHPAAAKFWRERGYITQQ